MYRWPQSAPIYLKRKIYKSHSNNRVNISHISDRSPRVPVSDYTQYSKYIHSNIFRVKNKRIILVLRGAIVEILIGIAPEFYKQFVVIEKNKKKLYIEYMNIIYGTIKTVLLFYNKSRKKVSRVKILWSIHIINI